MIIIGNQLWPKRGQNKGLCSTGKVENFHWCQALVLSLGSPVRPDDRFESGADFFPRHFCYPTHLKYMVFSNYTKTFITLLLNVSEKQNRYLCKVQTNSLKMILV